MKLLLLLFLLTISMLNAELIKKYYDTGELQAVVNSEYGIANGEGKLYYKNGKLAQTFTVKDDKKQRETIVRYMYDGRDTYTASNIIPNIIKKNNKLYTGKFIIPFEAGDTGSLGGTPEQEFYIKNGKMIGKYNNYNEDGSVSETGYFRNGLQHGKYIAYTSKGMLFYTRNYKNGKTDGIEVYYHYGSYTKRSETKYKKGKKQGLSKSYFKNGNLSSETVFINDKENGTHIEYWENGLISNKITMKNGKAISGTWWYDNGNVGGSMTNAQFKDFGLDY